MKRFWDKVEKTEGCWEWRAGRSSMGYGVFWLDGKSVSAHRWSWEASNGDVPADMVVCHSCDNPACVRPGHLFIGTQRQNQEDKARKDRSLYGERNPKAKLTTKQVQWIRAIYKHTEYTQKEIARLYGVSQSLISLIVIKKTWRRA